MFEMEYILVTIIELLRFLNRTRNHHAKFEIDSKILTYLNLKKEVTVWDGRTDRL